MQPTTDECGVVADGGGGGAATAAAAAVPAAAGTETIEGECPVCMMHVQLSCLDGCCHKFCMKCATETAKHHAVCPLCRSHFTTVTEPGFYDTTYHVPSGKFKIRGFVWVSAFCLGLANKLLFTNEEDEAYVVYMPEFLDGMMACHGKTFRLEEVEDTDSEGFPITDNRNLELFAQLQEDAKAWRRLPIIYTRLVVARHMENMIREKIFMRYKVCPGAIRSPALEDFPDYHYTLISLPIDSF
jgi:hypothetical protein